MPRRRRQVGFTYFFVMFLVFVMGITLAATGVAWRVVQQRDKEEELLFAGNEMRRAIEAYAARGRNLPQPYPRTLEDLLRDPRELAVRRYLRKIYRDPFTGGRDWGLIRTPQGGIVGVYSRSDARPLKQANFAPALAQFTGAQRHSDWRFIAGTAAVGGAIVATIDTLNTGAPITMSIDPAAAPSGGATPAVAVPNTPARPSININALARTATRDTTQNRCAAVQQLDAWNCAQVTAAWDQASGARCMASAALRFELCVANPAADLPILELRHF